MKGRFSVKEESNLQRVQKLEGKNLEGLGMSELIQIRADLMSSLCQVDVMIRKLDLNSNRTQGGGTPGRS